MPDATRMRNALRQIADSESGVWGQLARRALEDDDPMGAGWNRPAPASFIEMAEVLRTAAEHVEEGDSFEGFIQWVMPTDEPELVGFDCGVMARFRVGNLAGQGGLFVFTRGDE